jgi:hypothetical protein
VTPDHDSLRRAEEVLGRVLEEELVFEPSVAAVDIDEDPSLRRWYVRLEGVERDYITIWFTLRERSLHFEAYFMPQPIENHLALMRLLLRLNRKLVGVHFAIDGDDEVYLQGAIPVATVTDDELDRIIGTVYATVEQYFGMAMSVGYASRFAPRS